MPSLDIQRPLPPRILPRRALERVVTPGRKLHRAFAVLHGVLYGDNLKSRNSRKSGLLMQARARGFGDHRLGGFREGQENPHSGTFALDHAFQVADHADANILTRLDADDPQRGALGPEVEPPVEATIRALLAEVAGLGGDEGERPFLELMVFAPRRKVAGGVDVLRDAVGGELDGRKGIAQALFDQADGKVGDVDADPLPPEFFRRMDGGAATAERVKHHIAGVGGGIEDAFKEGEV